MEQSGTRYVVVGGTGILAPLGALLAAPGAHRVAVSRCCSPLQGDWDEFACHDTTDPAAVAALIRQLGPGGFDLVGYLPAFTAATWNLLCGKATRRVLIATSAYADPAHPDALAPWTRPGAVTTCLLGWQPMPAGGARWHPPEEIAAAARDALAAPPGARLALGMLRPWSGRPG